MVLITASVLFALMEEVQFLEVHSRSASSFQTFKNKHFKTYFYIERTKEQNVMVALIFNLEPLIIHSIIM